MIWYSMRSLKHALSCSSGIFPLLLCINLLEYTIGFYIGIILYMKGDHYLAEMLELMRSQGAKDNPVTLQLGVIQ